MSHILLNSKYQSFLDVFYDSTKTDEQIIHIMKQWRLFWTNQEISSMYTSSYNIIHLYDYHSSLEYKDMEGIMLKIVETTIHVTSDELARNKHSKKAAYFPLLVAKYILGKCFHFFYISSSLRTATANMMKMTLKLLMQVEKLSTCNTWLNQMEELIPLSCDVLSIVYEFECNSTFKFYFLYQQWFTDRSCYWSKTFKGDYENGQSCGRDFYTLFQSSVTSSLVLLDEILFNSK